MPKLKDLGINVIPETMRPPEIGGGGGGGACGNFTVNCIGCTRNLTVCACTEPSPCGSCTQQITACICTNASPCGLCSQQPTVCACTEPSPCGSCTQQITACICTNASPCGSCTQQITACICTDLSHCTPRGTLCGACSAAISVGCKQATCACSAVASICTGGSPTVITITPTTPQLVGAGGLTREHINALREQLNEQLKALDEAEKNIGPQTLEAIETREREIQQELEQLKARRASLKK